MIHEFTDQAGKRHIFNGGNPLPGCPENWDDANNWTKEANGDKDKWICPVWRFDCGFKLDFDGGLVYVSSRFYPPKNFYGPKWDGTIEISVLGRKVVSKRLECDTLDQLREEAQSYIDGVGVRISELLKSELTGSELEGGPE